MENTKEKEFEFSFTSIFKVFKGKLKIIIIIGLVAALLGGALGALLTVLSKKAYGNLLTFYLPTDEQNEYATILPLLESDLFLEKVLIDSTEEKYTDSNGETETIRVPNLPFTAKDKELYKQYTFEKLQAIETINKLKVYFTDIPYEQTQLKEKLTRATSDYTTAASVLNTYMSVQVPQIATDAHLKTIGSLETDLNEKAAAKEAAEREYNECIDEYRVKEKLYHDAEVTIAESDEKLDEITAPLYEAWKMDADNSKMISLAKEGIQYSFSKRELYPDSEAKDKAEIISSKFLYVKVEINGDEALADRIIKNMSKEMNDFIVMNSVPTEKYDIIKSSSISVPTSHIIYQVSLATSVIKYAVLFLAIAELLYVIKVAFSYFKSKMSLDDEDTKSLPKKEEDDNNLLDGNA